MASAAVIDARAHHYRYKWRATQAPPIQLTERDIAILEAIQRYRVLHRGQISELFFAGVNDEGGSARKRLGLLYQHGYLERIPRFISPPTNNPGPAYRLAKRGAVVLAQRNKVPATQINYWGKGEDTDSHVTKVGHNYLEHALLLADIRQRLEQWAQAAGCQIEQWVDYLELQKSWKTERVWIRPSPNGGRENVAVAPDGYFVLVTHQGRGHFFLEADRGTETLDRVWKRKLLAYTEYMTSGKFHQRYQVDRVTGFRVLAIVPSQQRALNLKRAAEKLVPVHAVSIFLFTCLDRFNVSSLSDPIWLRGGSTAAQALL
jgi:hypothetical protein